MTLKDGDDWNDHRKMYEYGFSTPWEPVPAEPEIAWPTPRTTEPAPVTSARNLTVMGNFLGEVPVAGGRWSTVPLIAGTTLGVQVPYGADVQISIELDRPLAAPVALGSKAGVAVFYVDGAEWGRVDALCGEEVPAALEAAAAPPSEQQLYELEQAPEAMREYGYELEQAAAWGQSYGNANPYTWEQAPAAPARSPNVSGQAPTTPKQISVASPAAPGQRFTRMRPDRLSTPDFQLFRLADKPLPEFRMRDGDQSLGTLPRGRAFPGSCPPASSG